jgi:hypothetical protein
VSQGGLEGGASRALVFLNFPAAFVAIALLGFAVSGLIGAAPFSTAPRRRGIAALAVIAALHCLVAALPGVVDQGDLDARPVNALPAIGVALVLALSLLALRRGPRFAYLTWSRRDRIGLAVIGVLAMLALPWLLADIGVYIGDIPGLDRIFMSKEFAEPNPNLRAVHLGHHHGLDGVLFVTTALLLGRGLRRVGPSLLRAATGWYLAFMLAYGIANFANDFWLEQVVKRGTTEHDIPSMLRPELSVAWGLLALGTVGARLVLFRPRGHVDEAIADPIDPTGTGAILAPTPSRQI